MTEGRTAVAAHTKKGRTYVISQRKAELPIVGEVAECVVCANLAPISFYLLL